MDRNLVKAGSAGVGRDFGVAAVACRGSGAAVRFCRVRTKAY